MTYKTIKHVFRNQYDVLSRYLGYPLCVDTARLIDDGLLLMKTEKYRVAPSVLSTVKKRENESPQHIMLKEVGRQLLCEAGETRPEFEYNYFDVYGHDLKIRVECGTTPIDRLKGFLHKIDDLNEFWVLPYHDEKVYRFTSMIELGVSW